MGTQLSRNQAIYHLFQKLIFLVPPFVGTGTKGFGIAIEVDLSCQQMVYCTKGLAVLDVREWHISLKCQFDEA